MSEAYEYTVMSLERRIIVFVTGCPGSGKSYFAGILKEKFPFFYMSAYDKTKELFFDKYGFDSLEERAELNKKSLSAYYSELAMEMEKGVPIIAEYPFCKLQHEAKLKELVEYYNYKALTITLYGKAEVMMDRGKMRDISDLARNPGHYLKRYHKDDYSLSDMIEPMSREEFISFVERKNYFMDIGDKVRIDVTDLDSIDYEKAYRAIELLYEERK